MKHFNFVEHKKLFYLITAVVLVIGIASMLIRGFNLDTDFVGGTTMQISMGTAIDQTVEGELTQIIGEVGGVSVTSIRSAGENGQDVIIKTKEMASETREAVYDAIQKQYDLPDGALVSTNNVGASISADLKNAAILSLSIAILLMLIYISVRFRLVSGLVAVICLAQDVFVMLAAYSLLQISVDSTVIAAMLTIVGYSINATIIIFDRIRENYKNAANRKLSFEDCVNNGIRSTVRRSLYTTLTTLFTIGMIYLLGVDSIKDFALPLIVGILAGLYSSVCLSGNLWSTFNRLFTKKKA